MGERTHVAPLDGLRALAVLAVLGFHLGVPGFHAGFLGVDVFFVLSGFLITSLLLGEHDRTGRVSLPRFWARRVRRLLPALVVVLLVVAAVTARTATWSQRESMRGDLLASTLYVANFRFIATSDYFHNTGSPSPLQHMWSLAIEEQFYLVWPAVVAAVGLWRRRRRLAVGLLAGAAAAASAADLALAWSPGDSTRAYMGTTSRVFEPLLGALAAALMTNDRFRAWVRRRSRAVTAVGLATLAVALATITSEGALYYRGGALIVTVATAGIVAGLWVGEGGGATRLLRLRPLVAIGLISYGVYLWHWPLTIWLEAHTATGRAHVERAVLVALMTFAAATASYFLVEQPIRQGRIGRQLSPRRLVAVVPVALVAVAGCSLVATSNAAPSEDTPVVVVVGDSVPFHLAPQLEQQGRDRGWLVVVAAHGGCSVTGERMLNPDGTDRAPDDRCLHAVEGQDALIDRVDPDVVVWWDRYSISDFRGPGGEHVEAGTWHYWDLRTASLAEHTRRLGHDGARVAYVAIEPQGVGIHDRCWPHCDPWLERQVNQYDTLTTAWNRVMQRYSRAHPDETAFVSITDAVCHDRASPCDDRIDGRPARYDGTHYGGAGADLAARTLLDRVAPALQR